jgi:RNA polymerase sigma-70 factor (ECF subfamily)
MLSQVSLKHAVELIPTRSSLLAALKDLGDQERWRTFYETYSPLIYRTAAKAGLAHAEAEDVVQETVIAVSKRIIRFQYHAANGSFKNWLLRLTSWQIGRQFRKRKSEPALSCQAESSTGDPAEIESIPDPASPELEALWDREWEQNLLGAAIRSVKHKVDAKNYQIFDLCFFKHRPVSEVARGLHVSRPRVYLAKHLTARLLGKEIHRLSSKPI